MSEGLKEERAAGKAIYPGLLGMKPTEMPIIKATANTNIVYHAGKLLALVESSLPTALTPCTLETLGAYDFGGKLMGSMTAHPKLDPETGEMLFFGYAPFPPYLQFHAVDRSGALVRSEVIDVEWPSMMHDFAITKDHVIFLLCPIVFSFEEIAKSGSIFAWKPELGTRIGVMPRTGGNADVRWFETDSCYVFHPMNAYTEGDEVVLDVARYEQLLFMNSTAAREPEWRDKNVARLHRWRLDLRSGGVKSEPLDDRDGEFPRVDERLVGRKHRFGYMAATGAEGNTNGIPVWTAIQKYDLERGGCETREYGLGNGVGEPLFVPRRADAAEDDGYVLVLHYDKARNSSEFDILDARNIGGEAIARVRIPNRIPYGFHGNWVEATA
jgi:carotenoid cleavage dioxygenase